MDNFPSNSKYYYALIFAWSLCAMMFTTTTVMCSSNVQCNEKDKEMLLKFEEGAKDPSGMILSSWSSTHQHDCCQWNGVTCHNLTGRVIQLNLPCSTIGSGYTDLDYKSHCLTGRIHLLSLLQIEFLQHLNLSGNDFFAMSSTAYDQYSGNSSALRYLDLSFNENLVIHNLQWLSRVSSLESINLSGIDLHMETNWLQLVTMLPSLSELHLKSCHLENINPSLQYANFTSLKVLDLASNAFQNSELPIWLFNLTCDISHIDLKYNFLRGQLPKTLPNLRALDTLDLAKNHLNESIPDWLGQLEQLKYLNLCGNLFSGPFPTNLGNLPSLVFLDVNSNLFTGVVSERNFAKLPHLKVLFLYVNSPAINFDFDFNWIPPFQLNRVMLGPVGPRIPHWLYTQTSLRELHIIKSKIVFEDGDKFWSFVFGLEFLRLEYNSIDGDLSNVLLNSTIITLSSNNLKGHLPRLSSNVAVFHADNNSLSGSTSTLLCHNMNGRSNLKYLDISNNHLSGGLTDCWMNWKSLLHINLGNNNLTGKIPPSMGLLSNLTSLHLHENNLFGGIPLSLQNCHSLSILNVRENNLSGNIPNWIPRHAKALQLRSNQFTGNIPPQICQISSLIILDFAFNKISGYIPNCLNNIIALVSNNTLIGSFDFIINVEGYRFKSKYNLMLLIKGQGYEYKSNLELMHMIDLSSNDLTGTIPPQMFKLIGLQFLNLSHNGLTGTVPKEIGNMKQLESLDLSKNQLWGEIPETMSKLSFLDTLNLSLNNFNGKIPLGTQLQSFSPFSYIGNAHLCGPPLPKNCSDDGTFEGTKAFDDDDHDNNIDDGESEFLSCLYMGLGFGFATGFWGVCVAIFFNRKWRHAYFWLLYDLRDRIYVSWWSPTSTPSVEIQLIAAVCMVLLF